MLSTTYQVSEQALMLSTTYQVSEQALMLSTTYKALLAAGASDEKARGAAEEIAAYENPLRQDRHRSRP
jgi:hypothetical protein